MLESAIFIISSFNSRRKDGERLAFKEVGAQKNIGTFNSGKTKYQCACLKTLSWITKRTSQRPEWTRSGRAVLKFIYSEKATKFCEISTLNLTTVHTVKSKVEFSQNFVAFSEHTLRCPHPTHELVYLANCYLQCT